MQVAGVVWGFGLPENFDFEGLQASESEVEFRDGVDKSVETRMIVVFAVSGGDVQAQVLEFADGELLGEEEWQVLAAEVTCAHAAVMELDEDFDCGAGHDGGEEEDVLDLVVAGVILPVRDAYRERARVSKVSQISCGLVVQLQNPYCSPYR